LKFQGINGFLEIKGSEVQRFKTTRSEGFGFLGINILKDFEIPRNQVFEISRLKGFQV
jgi:hypothetical protein